MFFDTNKKWSSSKSRFVQNPHYVSTFQLQQFITITVLWTCYELSSAMPHILFPGGWCSIYFRFFLFKSILIFLVFLKTSKNSFLNIFFYYKECWLRWNLQKYYVIFFFFLIHHKRIITLIIYQYILLS